MRSEAELRQRHSHLHHALVNTAWSLSPMEDWRKKDELKTQMNMIDWVLNEN